MQKAPWDFAPPVLLAAATQWAKVRCQNFLWMVAPMGKHTQNTNKQVNMRQNKCLKPKYVVPHLWRSLDPTADETRMPGMPGIQIWSCRSFPSNPHLGEFTAPMRCKTQPFCQTIRLPLGSLQCIYIIYIYIYSMANQFSVPAGRRKALCSHFL